MDKYNDVKYSTIRKIISDGLNNKGAEYVEEQFLRNDDTRNLFANMTGIEVTEEDARNLIDIEKNEIEKTKRYKELSQKGIILSRNEASKVEIPTQRASSWVRYKRHLSEKGFSEASISNLEHDAFDVLKQLSDNTTETGPIKGLVVGSVQSGKTSHMTALMTMAAEYGWNVFIVVSGMIENLREQTLDRMDKELKETNGSNIWVKIDKPSRHMIGANSVYDRKLKSRRNEKLFTVILKNKSWLNNLHEWLTLQPTNMSDMKILIIDDEADYGSVNTSDLSNNEERKTINQQLVNIVGNKDPKGKLLPHKYGAMNYVAYTATPYANILSEPPSDESLYPRDFIAVMNKAKEHFGLPEIFGVPGTDKDGIDIVRQVLERDLEQIVAIHQEGVLQLPESLKDSVAYFIGASASLRTSGFVKPLTMLVHTSNLQNHHTLVHDAIRNWLVSEPNQVKDYVRNIWQEELVRFDKRKLKSTLNLNDEDIKDVIIPLSFSEINKEIDEILHTISHIKVDEDNRLVYHNGIHMCIDNSLYTGIEDDNYVRLAYPPTKQEKSSLFLVVGGTTLARGLTLEGLITSYFLRITSQIDTLMQMGRWFGFRQKYEIFPRIWMTEATREKFEVMSLIDYDLREELKDYRLRGGEFDKVGPRITMSPPSMYLNLTSKNKQRSMKQVTMDFIGRSMQTYIFDKDEDIQRHNLAVAESFINSLGMPFVTSYARKDNVYWQNISFDIIKDKFLKEFKVNQRIKNLSYVDKLIDWVEHYTSKGFLENWNVILGTRGSVLDTKNMWELEHIKVNKVTRTKKDDGSKDINIGALRGPSDLYADINMDTINDLELVKKIEAAKTSEYNYVRQQLGLEKTPQLIIYCIDKDSEPSGSSTRKPLGVDYDIIGFHISIPGGERDNDYKLVCTIDVGVEQVDVPEVYSNED